MPGTTILRHPEDQASAEAPPAQSRGSSIAISSASNEPGVDAGRVLPRGERREAHQHALDPRVGLQPEQRAAVVHQVELDVAAPPDELEPPLPLAVRQAPPALDDRPVRRGQHAAHVRPQTRASRVEVEPAVAGAQVVEEDAADAAPLVAAVRVDEVLVAPAS